MRPRLLLNAAPVDGGAMPTSPSSANDAGNSLSSMTISATTATPQQTTNGTGNGTSNGNGSAKTAKPGDPHPDLSKPPASPSDPPRIQPIWVAPDDWTRQQTELQSLREFQRTAQAEAEVKDAARIKALAEKGQLDEALKQLSTKYETKLREQSLRAETIENEWLSEKRNSAIEQALVGKTFSGVNPQETAALVRRLLESEVEAVRDDSSGRPLIRDRVTKRPAAEFLQERLDSPAFAVFFAATNRGGSGTDGTRPAAASPKNPGDPNAVFAAAFLKQQEDAKNARF